VQCSAVQCSAVQSRAVQCSAVQCSALVPDSALTHILRPGMDICIYISSNANQGTAWETVGWSDAITIMLGPERIWLLRPVYFDCYLNKRLFDIQTLLRKASYLADGLGRSLTCFHVDYNNIRALGVFY
jgi:hypothetical protein